MLDENSVKAKSAPHLGLFNNEKKGNIGSEKNIKKMV
jgi:hypothetical protein